MRKAVAIYAGAKYFVVLISLLINAILSRILTPQDYGVIAVVTAFISLFNVISTFGLGTGVIQNKSLNTEQVNHIFSCTVYLGIGIGCIFMLLSHPIAYFYSDDRYLKLVPLFSIAIIVNAWNVIPDAIMLKEERFTQLACRVVFSTLLGGSIAIIYAVIARDYYALVIQTISTAVIQFMWNFFCSKLKFCLIVRFDGIRKIGNYSLFQYLYSMMLCVFQNVDNLIVGKLLGAEKLAYYNKSYMLMRYPINYIPHAVTPVFHPLLSRYQDDKDYIYQKYLNIIKPMSLIGIYCSFIFIFEAEEIILFLFGEQWLLAVPCCRIFGFSIWVQIINAFAGVIYQSANSTKEMFQSGVIHTIFTFIAMLVGLFYKNIEILALALTISWNIKFFIESYFLVRKSLNQKLSNYLYHFGADLIIFLIGNVVLNVILLKIDNSVLISIILKTALITITYIILLVITRQYKYILSVLPNLRR